MLVREDACSKATPPFVGETLKAQYRKRTQLAAKMKDDSIITRASAHLKKIPYKFPKEASRSTPDAKTGLHDTNGEQGWRSGDSALLPPMWPGFDSGPVP